MFDYLFRRIFSRQYYPRRIFFSATVLLALILELALFLIFVPGDPRVALLVRWYQENAYLLTAITAGAFFLYLVGTVLNYFLQTRDRYETISQQSRRNEGNDNLGHRLERLQREIAEIRLGKQASIDIPQITNEVRAFVQENLVREILTSVDEKYRKFLVEKASYIPMKDRLEALSATLSVQLKSQSNRADFNLIAGALVAALGFGALGWLTVFGYMDSTLNGNLERFAVWYIPKLTFVIVIEAFSYFFLNLYRSGLGEVKFFQNEITNLESKIAAGYAAIGSEDHGLLRVAIERLANTERNFVLKKGERNVSEQLEGKIRSQFVDAIVEALKVYNSKESNRA